MDGTPETGYTADEVNHFEIIAFNLSIKPTHGGRILQLLFFFFFELQTPMVSYVNVHAILEGRRDRAKKSPSDDSVLSQVILSCFVIRRLDASCMCWCWLFFRVWLLFCTVGISFWSFIFYGLLLLLLLRVSKFERLL